MKILKIEFQNINSLRGNHSIDFTIEPFKTNALFAITGPTGSGKSTILDVIALALFNQIPRLGKISLREIISKGAILTRNQKEAMARVSYASKNGNFSSTWSISTNRNGNLRDYDMELRNTDSGQLLDLKKSEIPSKNEELIGLNYNQFIKSVLLAQGEFAQFLQAKKDDRGALLEKITGTGIYRRLGQLAFERHKLENQDIKTQQDVIAIKTAELLDPEVAKNHQSELQKYQEKLQPLSDKIEQLQKKISLKEAINKQEKEISAITLQQENAAKKFRFFVENKGKSLKNHEKLEPFSTQITQRAQFINNQEELLTDQQLSITNQEKIAHDKISLLSEINALIKKEPKSDEIIDSLQYFAANVDRLQREKQDKLKMYSALKEQAQSLLGEINYTLDKDVSNDITPIENSLEQSKNGLKSLKIDLKSVNLNSVDEEKKRLRTEIKNLNLTNGIKETIESITSIIDKTALKQENLTNQLKTLPKEIELSAANSERYDQEREKLKIQQQNERLQASLSDHRKQLHDGKPCPLCGSLEHPF
ncbi:MAG: AAA family ATPase, partial [Leeuwenhoekiella sp.]